MFDHFSRRARLAARIRAVALSKDPAKARRQLEGLALGSERRAASLRARIAEIDAASEAPSEAQPTPSPAPPTSEAASEVPSVATSEVASPAAGARIQRGSYTDPPPARPPEPTVDEDDPAETDEDDLEHEDEHREDDGEEEQPAEPGTLVRFGAKLLGVE